MKPFKKRYWVNLNWLTDGGSEQFFYEKKADAIAVLPEGDIVAQVEIREIKREGA